MTKAPQNQSHRTIRPALPPAVLGATALIAGAMLAETDWFTLIRYAVSILALITAVIAFQHRQWLWALPMVPIAIMWNPVVPIDLSAITWVVGHYAAGFIFIAVGALVRVREEPAGEKK